MNEQLRKLASVEHPTIAAIVHGLYRLPTHHDALAKLRALQSYFVTSKRRKGANETTLWIRDFALSKQDRQDGFLGQFAQVSCEEVGGKWRLIAKKLQIPLARHPERRYLTNMAQPNWGHPLLRAVRKETIYPTAEAAQAVLMQLHEQYPHSSIPGMGSLRLLIYGHAEQTDATGGKPIQKYVLSIQALKEGGCRIAWRVNTPRKPLPKQAEQPTQGYFSTMVKMKKPQRAPLVKKTEQ